LEDAAVNHQTPPVIFPAPRSQNAGELEAVFQPSKEQRIPRLLAEYGIQNPSFSQKWQTKKNCFQVCKPVRKKQTVEFDAVKGSEKPLQKTLIYIKL
jgi:hypothetical protein